MGNLVHIGRQLVVHLDQRGVHLLTHFKLDRYHTLAAFNRRVDVFDPGNLPHDPFQRLDGQGGYLVNRRTGVLDKDIDHRHGDLRILLPGRHHQARHAQQEHGDIEQRRERRLDEKLGGLARKPQLFLCFGTSLLNRIGIGVTHTVVNPLTQTLG